MDHNTTGNMLPAPILTRRELLQGLGALATLGLAPPLFAQDPLAPLTAARFAILSRTTTGFDFIDPDTASAMLRALTAAVGATDLAKIANLAAVIAPAQLAGELKIAGVDGAAMKVLTALLTGMLDTPQGRTVVTYDHALAWQAVPWTKPNALCGGEIDYWATAPRDSRP
ncbi:MAG: sugar dehydrogenase complex small subunit [Casimicrobiaceae bacterium]